MDIIALLLLAGVITGAIGAAIGSLRDKGNGTAGFFLGALFGPIGWIIVAVLPAARKPSAPARRAEPWQHKPDPLAEFEMRQRVASGPPTPRRPVSEIAAEVNE